MNLPTVLLVVALTTAVAAAALWWMQRRAAQRRALVERGWQISRSGEETTLVPDAGDWTITTRQSFVAQMSPPSTRILVSTWTSPVPRVGDGVLVVGPAPPPDLRDLTVSLIGSSTPAMTRWLGIDRVSGGRPMTVLPGVDDRLLAVATAGYRPTARLTAVAEAISGWCSVYGSEREQPVVSIADTGVCVRVRVDVLRSPEQTDAFIELGLRCRDALGRSVA